MARGSSSPGLDPRLLAAWHEWLNALATDAEAATAAAHVYGELDAGAREAWLDALREDTPSLAIPPVAIYGPLLAVEADPIRRDRIARAMGPGLDGPVRPLIALRGVAIDGARVVALVLPLYLEFVRVLWCRFVADVGFAWAQHDAILHLDDAPCDGAVVDGVRLEATPTSPVIEELALAILAHARRGTELPPSLRQFSDVFDARVDHTDAP